VIKKCPKCGSKKISGEQVCPDCGYQIEETDQHTNEEKKNDIQSSMDSSEDFFPETELNDPIEWSELTDLPLESVMELFKEDTIPEENNLLQTVDNVSNKKGNSINLDEDKLEPSVNEEEPENEIKIEQQKRVAELKEFVDHEKENSILSAYIKAHREDTTEEHAEELMRMIKEELATKNKENSSEQLQKKAEDKSNLVQEDTSISKVLDDALKPVENVSAEKNEEEKNSDKKVAEENEKNKNAETQKQSQELANEKKENINRKETLPLETITKETATFSKTDNQQTSSKKSNVEKTFIEEDNEERLKNTDSINENSAKEEVAKDELATSITNKAENPSLTEPTESMKESEPSQKKKKKGPYLALVALLLLGVGGWTYYDHQQNVQAQIAAQEEEQKQKISNLQQTLAEFYTDSSRQFIRTSMINQDLTKLKISLNEVKEEKEYNQLEKTYEDIQSKIKAIKHVNELFTSSVIEDDHLVNDPKLKEDKEVQLLTTDNTAFGQLVQQAQEKAEEQYKQLQTAKEKVKVIYNNDKVIENATRDQYKEAKVAVDQVKNEELIVSLKDQLQKVDEILTAKEKEAAKRAEEAKKAEEAKRVEEAQQTAQASQQEATTTTTTITSTTTNSANQPIMSTRQSDVSDTTNAAWNWASGVQESVIATCIQRGYIVEGGYRLEKARIENGEGYYNLYATSTKSALMNGIGESALPFYIVTINCKTGWFGGNGSR
jgi:hypothetical protein